MSQNAARKNLTSVHAKRGNSRKASFALNWQSVKTYVETAMPFEAGVASVDLDSVILYHQPEDGTSHRGRVLPLGRKLVQLLKDRGYRVVVLTARKNHHQKILSHLAWYGVWVDQVTNRKPYADAYFDDKAVRVPKNWR